MTHGPGSSGAGRSSRLDLDTHGGPVLEAAAGALHHALLAARRTTSRRPVARGGARGRAARVRDGLPPRAPLRRRGGRRSPASSPRLRCSELRVLRNAALGNSEGLLVGLVLWAFERHLDGRRDHAFALGVAAGAAAARGRGRSSASTGSGCGSRAAPAAALVAGPALIPAAVVPPRAVGLGRSAPRLDARERRPTPTAPPSPSSPRSRCSAVQQRTARAGRARRRRRRSAWAACAWVRRRREGTTLVLAARRLRLVRARRRHDRGRLRRQPALPHRVDGAVCVLGGIGVRASSRAIGWPAARRRPARAGRAAAACLRSVLIAAAPFDPRRRQHRRDARAAGLRGRRPHDLKLAIARAGGARPAARLRGVFTGPFQTRARLRLGVHSIEVRAG